MYLRRLYSHILIPNFMSLFSFFFVVLKPSPTSFQFSGMWVYIMNSSFRPLLKFLCDSVLFWFILIIFQYTEFPALVAKYDSSSFLILSLQPLFYLIRFGFLLSSISFHLVYWFLSNRTFLAFCKRWSSMKPRLL